MFNKLILTNFKSFDNFELDLTETQTTKKTKKLAMLYGENGIGKTSIVEAFELLSTCYYSLQKLTSYQTRNIRKQNEFLMDYERFFIQFGIIPSFIHRYRKIEVKDLTVVRFEGYLKNETKFVYEMVFNSKEIVKERLLFNNNLSFKFDKTSSLYSIEEDFGNEFIKAQLIEMQKAYFGKFTFMSIVKQIKASINNSVVKSIFTENLNLFMDEIENIVVFKNKLDFNNVPAQDSAFKINLIEGKTSSIKDEGMLKKAENALSIFFISLYSNIKCVKYLIKNTSSTSKDYSLCFVEKKKDGYINVPFEMASTGTKKMITIFNILYNVCYNKKTVIVDEIDSGINDLLLTCVFNSLKKELSGQLIFTTHNTLLLSSEFKKYIYLLNREPDGNISCYSLDSFGRKIQNKTDVIGQYLKGLYGGVPQCGEFCFDDIMKASNE